VTDLATVARAVPHPRSSRDGSRIIGRAARDWFGVSYPADLLLAEEDRVAAMRWALVAVLDRHVRTAGLDVQLFSEVHDPKA
jgi:hypothetical protein